MWQEVDCCVTSRLPLWRNHDIPLAQPLTVWQPLHFPHEQDDFVIPTLSVLLLFCATPCRVAQHLNVTSENAYRSSSLLAIWHDP
jgi:hypothetical protein